VRATRHTYEAPGWGVGELWVRDGVLVQHELASETLRAALEREQSAAGDRVELVREVVPVGGGRGSGPRAPRDPQSRPPNGGARIPARTLPPNGSPDRAAFVPDLCRRFQRHLEGEPTSYEDVELDVDWATPLQREFIESARAIPWGEVVSYGELAALAGRPGAARAAGSFCADNRYSLIIPCHRVVAANGIGGYGSAGPELKRRLLALEGVEL
jgi:O-6-methylguanine DNA methyltransferase